MDVAFNTKTAEGIAGDDVRVVGIEGWDVAVCSGTHVENTAEIGLLTILECLNPGEGLTCINFAVGPTATAAREGAALVGEYLAVGIDTSVDSKEVVADVTDEFGGTSDRVGRLAVS